MRRVSAALLMDLFSLSLIGPVLFASDADSQLPACCRRGGAHNCVMQAGDAAAGAAFRAAHCPLLPSGQPAPAKRIASLVPSLQTVFTAFVSDPLVHPHSSGLRSMCDIRAEQKRGPPSLS